MSTAAGARAIAACVAVALLLPAAVAGQVAETAQPLLGPLDQSAHLMGSVTSGLPGETWAYRQLPFDVGPPVVDGQPLAFGPVTSALRPDPQLAFLRHVDGAGWQVAQTPRDRDGAPWRGVVPNSSAARVLPGGGGFLVGRDANAPPDEQAKLLVRDAGGLFAEVASPQPPVVKPAGDPGAGDARETLAADRGLGTVAAAGYDFLGRMRILVAPQGRGVQDGILRFDGRDWAREPIELPSPAPRSFQVLALDATDAANAWLLAAVRLPDDPLAPLGETAQPGVVLYRRVVADGVASWQPRDLGAPVFAAAATPLRGIADLHALAGGAQQALTVSGSGIWIDGELRTEAGAQDFTLYYDVAAGRVVRSWCDAVDSGGVAVCDVPLGFAFSRRTGYRSIGFDGPGTGSRIVSNPLDPGGDDTSNGGTYARFDGGSVARLPAGNGNLRASAAFASPSRGWLEGPVEVGAQAPPARLVREPVSVRAPFAAVAGEPGKPAGAADARALAVGASGAVARYVPGQGWVREFLLTPAGAVTSPTLRGVAWPEPARAYAVGDLGAMWLWRADTGLWERDGATPVGFEGNLLGVAFAPGSDARGYAVGRAGTLLRYDKTWTQEALPAGIETRDLTAIAFAGGQAIVAAGADLLVNDGGAWRVDEQARALLSSVPGAAPRLLSVAGLPDGGAVAAGRDVVLVRDGPGLPWRFTDQPLPGSTAIAAAAVRDGFSVRAIVSIVPRLQYPASEDLPAADPNVPPVILPPTPLPGDGYVLREVPGGWRDEQRAAFNGAGADRPAKPDPVLAFDLDAAGRGWAVGGWSGEADSAGRGSSARNSIGRNNRLRVQTAAIYRYLPDGAAGDGPAAASAIAAPVALDPGVARFAVAGHAQCEGPCAQLAGQRIGPDRMIESVLARVGALRGAPGGPRFLLYTGGRTRATGAAQPAAEARRYASLLGSAGGLPVYPAVSAGDAEGNAGAAAFRAAFAGFPAPVGDGPAPAAITPAGTAGGGEARTHYAFDSTGAGGAVRVIVIDNSRGSLAASDPFQNPTEPQEPWLVAQLAAARARSIPAVVMGSRDLNSRFAPALNVATDADAVARILLDGGASAYFFERPEENRAGAIPAGSPVTIPQVGTGTLGYRSPLSNTIAPGQPDALFGDAGFVLAEVDVARRDPATNRAPVRARLVPVVEDLALLAVDGILLRRSRPSLFQGLGRKPIAGDRWGEVAGSDGNPNPPGGDPYTAFPATQCTGPTCASRMAPEFTFTSSDPDIADFVRQDPASTNLRKPFLDATDKVVTDAASGLLCPFNAGTTTVTISAGGLAFSQRVTVLAGTVQRPCGTRPLNPSRFPVPAPAAVAAPAPAGSAPAAPSGAPAVPPTPQLPAVKAVPKPPLKRPAPLPQPEPPAALPPLANVNARVPGAPPPGTSGFARPIPPGGATVRAFERKREEEAAPEQSQAYATYGHDDDYRIAPYLLGAILLTAIAGAGAGGAVGRRRARPAFAVARAHDHRNRPGRDHR